MMKGFRSALNNVARGSEETEQEAIERVGRTGIALKDKGNLGFLRTKKHSMWASFMRSLNIDEQIANDRKSLAKECILLCLGSGESGKSTFVRQIKHIHGGGFSEDELERYRFSVLANAIDGLKMILDALEEKGEELVDDEMKESCNVFLTLLNEMDGNIPSQSRPRTPEMEAFFREHLPLVRNVLDSPEIRAKSLGYFGLSSAEQYFIRKTSMIGAKDFTPSADDVFRMRQQTNSVYETQVALNELNIRVIDVGGQKGKRRKWLDYFDGSTAVLYFVDLASYDLVLAEDGKTNRLLDSLELFDHLVNNPVFNHTGFLLILNKKDLFFEKIQHVELNVCFPDYDGTRGDPMEAAAFIKEKFLERCGDQEKEVYSHLTCAIDTENIREVFADVGDLFISSMMENLRKT